MARLGVRTWARTTARCTSPARGASLFLTRGPWRRAGRTWRAWPHGTTAWTTCGRSRWPPGWTPTARTSVEADRTSWRRGRFVAIVGRSHAEPFDDPACSFGTPGRCLRVVVRHHRRPGAD